MPDWNLVLGPLPRALEHFRTGNLLTGKYGVGAVSRADAPTSGRHASALRVEQWVDLQLGWPHLAQDLDLPPGVLRIS